MKSYEQWKKEYISKEPTRKYLSDKQIRSVYDEEVQLVENEKRRVADSKAKQVEAQKTALKEKIDKTNINDIAQRCKSEGLSSLSIYDLEVIALITDQFLEGVSLDEECSFLAKSMITDPVGSNFLLIRKTHSLQQSQNSALKQNEVILEKLGVQLSGISQNTAGIKMASMFTGFAAARHIGDEIAEDFGGGD